MFPKVNKNMAIMYGKDVLVDKPKGGIQFVDEEGNILYEDFPDDKSQEENEDERDHNFRYWW
jgi:hypothetical protein